MAERGDLAMDASAFARAGCATRPGLVTERQRVMGLAQLLDQRADRLGGVVDLAEIAHLTLARRFGQRHRDAIFVGVQTDKMVVSFRARLLCMRLGV
jgi:hypothetical protein